MNNKKNGIPKLRFPGFTGAWEQRKLGEIFEIQSGFTGDAQLNTGKFKVSRIETISNGVIDSKKIGFSNVIPDKKYKLNVGDILYSNINSIDHIGKIAEYIEDIGLYHGINLLRLASISDNPDFLFYELNTEEKRNWAKSHANKAVNQASINQTELKKQKLSIPVIEEQTKISNFLQHFDSLITLHQRKLEHLQEQKKGLLQKMFPKKGETVPEVRFPGFTDAWEQRKLGEVADVIDPHPSHRAPAEVKIGIPFIGISDVNEIGEINYSTVRVVDEDIYEEHHRRYDLSIPSLGIGRVASLGKVIRLRNDIGKYAISPTMSVLQPDTRIEINYLYSYMNSSQFQKQFSAKSNGSTRQSVGIKDLRTLVVSVPSSSNEQQKIGEYFSKFDSLIALHQRKLDHLELMKKGLLQQMFV